MELGRILSLTARTCWFTSRILILLLESTYDRIRVYTLLMVVMDY